MRAARALYQEYRLDPGLARSSESLPWCLARAFRIEYEAGRFDNAYEIAAMDVEIFPGRTTPRDRLLAAAVKRVEAACTRGDAPGAERVLDTARDLVSETDDVARLEREVCPRIAATAVRAGAWDLAERMVLRFLLVEPDAVESAQLAAWVKDRRAELSDFPPRPIGALGALDPALTRVSSLLYSSSPFPLAGPAAPLRGQRPLPGALFDLREGTGVEDPSPRH
jgi:hypothetical protein